MVQWPGTITYLKFGTYFQRVCLMFLNAATQARLAQSYKYDYETEYLLDCRMYMPLISYELQATA